MDSLIQRLKQRSLSFYLLFALVSKKTLISSTISLRYFLHHVFFHYCGHLNWYKMWSCDKWITNRPTSHHKDYQRLSEEVQLYLRRGCGGGLQWSLQSWEDSLSTVSLCQRCLLLFGPGRISSLQLTSDSHRNYPCTHAPGEKWGESSWRDVGLVWCAAKQSCWDLFTSSLTFEVLKLI